MDAGFDDFGVLVLDFAAAAGCHVNVHVSFKASCKQVMKQMQENNNSVRYESSSVGRDDQINNENERTCTLVRIS